MKTNEKQPENEGIDFTPGLVRTILDYQNNNNSDVYFHTESIADFICLFMEEISSQISEESNQKALPYLKILAEIRTNIKSLKATEKED